MKLSPTFRRRFLVPKLVVLGAPWWAACAVEEFNVNSPPEDPDGGMGKGGKASQIGSAGNGPGGVGGASGGSDRGGAGQPEGGSANTPQNLKPTGDQCTRGGECASGYCVDEVCCESACDGQCSACGEPTLEGQCVTVDGAPRGRRVACEVGEVCVAGGCGIDCGNGLTQCSGECFDLANDPNHCGACALAKCTAPLHAKPICSERVCDFECDAGYTRCGNQCVDLTNDNGNCGKCGEVCMNPVGGTIACEDSKCKVECNAGLSECRDGCFNTASDVNHCGANCEVCTALPYTTAKCSSSSCERPCEAQYAPLSCHTSEAPACGIWSFKAGTTEGWSVPLVAPSAATGPATARTEGGGYLVVPVAISDEYFNVDVKLCPSAARVPLSGKLRITFQLVTTGVQPLDPQATAMAPSLYDGTDNVWGVPDYVVFDPTVVQNATFDVEDVTATRLSLYFHAAMTKTWTGEFRLLEVSIQPN